jgi:CRP-like cAMP-binding protein
LRDTMRSATVVSLTQCRLLTLSAEDFARLLRRHPALEKKMRSAARTTVKAFADADELAQGEVDAAGYWREVPDDQDFPSK